VKPRTATRPVPGTPSADHPTGQPASSGTDVGAIAGGTVGGVVALIALITAVIFCLRRRHGKQAIQTHPELDTNTKSELDGLTVAQKPIVNYSVSEGETILSSTTPTPAYSPQASPPPATNSWNGEQRYCQGLLPHQGGHTYPQPYYPPPAEPSTSARRMDPHDISAELPEVRSPTNAELPDVRSPVSGESPDMRYPVPVRGLQ
jgi:hypothetical protein